MNLDGGYNVPHRRRGGLFIEVDGVWGICIYRSDLGTSLCYGKGVTGARTGRV